MGNIKENDVLRTIAAVELSIGKKGETTELAFKIIEKYPKVALLANFNNSIKSMLGKVSLLTDIDEAEIAIIRSRTKIDKRFLRKAKKLKTIITATHGVDHIDFNEINKRKIKVYEVATSSRSVAELTFAFIFALARNNVRANNTLKKGLWLKNDLIGVEIYGKTLGIIGLGRIGKEVSKIESTLGMRILVYDPKVDRNIREKYSYITFTSNLEELLKNSDFVSIHVALTDDTKGLIGEKELRMMKPTAYLINTSRAKIIDINALYKAVKEKWIAGAAFDVFDTEPPIDNRFAEYDNIVVTPHIGANMIEANRRKEEMIISILRNYLT